jgi:hypothetical protein
MIKRIKSFLWVFMAVALLMVLSNESYARGDGNPAQQISLAKSADGAVQTASNIGNWGYWFKNDGTSANDPFTGGSGGYYPVGTAGAIYRDGLVWGGIVDDPNSTTQLRVGGNTYSVGTQPGVIGGDPNSSRIYRIRADWAILTPAMVYADAAMLNNVSQDAVTDAMANEVIELYKSDWKNWPVDLGAPYYDVDGDGAYIPVLDENGMPIPAEYDADGNLIAGGDYPGIANADQVIWFAINDMNEGNTTALSGSPPIGLEIQTTAWAYNQRSSILGQLLFKKYKIINKSGFTINDMYVCQWCDPDLGDYGDDITGCDVDLSLMYAYNGYPEDSQYKGFGLAPAAVGYDFFQGPIVPSPGDTAVFDLKKVPDHKNLPMTSYGYFGSGTKWTDPTMGNYDGTLQWYNLLRGYAPTVDIDNPTKFVHTTGPEVDQPTKFPLNGDPVTKTGDVDGIRYQPGDRRMLQSTGPFTMADGDTQEVVVSVIGGTSGKAGVGDNVQSLFALKVNDEIAQMLYNTLFKQVPKPPAPPKIAVTPYTDKIAIDWSFDQDAVDKTESSNTAGYKFEGYNVYQLPSATSPLSDAKLVAVYDEINGVKTIMETRFLPQYGQGVEIPVRFGTDSGIKRYFTADKDYITGNPLYRGTTYYFAVTAYNYNKDATVVKSMETTADVYAVTVQDPNPGWSAGSEPAEEIPVEHSAGAAEQASVDIKVVDPKLVTEDDYKVFFETWHYYMDVDGQWKRTGCADSLCPIGKDADVSPSTLSAIAYTSPAVGTRDLKFILDLVSPDYNYAEGVELTFPSNVKINSATGPEGITAIVDADANTVLFGNAVHDSTDLTGAGAFAGGEVMTVNIDVVTLPLDVDYVIYDDGWATLFCADPANQATCDAYGLTDAVVVNAEGTCTISEEGYAFKSVNVWNVENTTTGQIVLDGQAKLYNTEADKLSAPVVDGLQFVVGGSYAAPYDFADVVATYLDGSTASVADFRGNAVGVGSYGIYGWAASARSIDAYGKGTSDLNVLIQDYEIRWTGEYDTTEVGGVTLISVKDGTGSLAWIDGARGYSLADHPFNPNPGTDAAFMVRVPFEVWNVVTDQQIQIEIYDRKGDPTTGEFQAWNPHDRMYTNFINIPYTEDISVIEASLDQMTWNLVWWDSEYKKGEKVYVQYANPIIVGSDEFSFSTAGKGVAYNADDEKADVEKINVFPNPYYASNPLETSRFDRYVTFNHLPQKADIRIFTLSGTQVRYFQKDDADQFFKWDLKNERGLPVASGVYIVHIDMPDLGKEKVLKVFIVQAQEYLEFY